MQSTLSWVDHDSKARERALQILSLFREKESRDELGLGAIRDSFADQLFPGTSTIQTRLRYMFFVAWIYRELEEKQVPPENFAKRAEQMERALVQPLLASDDNAGVFGKTAGNRLKRLPSSVYWAGLGTWGIRRIPFSQDEYHRRIREIYSYRKASKAKAGAAKGRGDDSDCVQGLDGSTWHPKLPAQPEGFPLNADLFLSREEAEFIRDRIQTSRPESLLCFLSLHSKPIDTDAPWEHPDASRFSVEQKELLFHARLFSETMNGAALSYNLQLAKLRGRKDLIEKHEKSFENWADSLPLEEVKAWSTERLWELTINHGHTITPQTKTFVQQWVELTRKSPKDLVSNTEAQNLVKAREIRLKGPRSRFKNLCALEQWGGYSGVEKFIYRWSNVKALLKDLFQGMNRG